MIVDQSPHDSGSKCLDLGMKVWALHEIHQAWEEGVGFGEMYLVGSVVKGRISDEQQDVANEVADWRQMEILGVCLSSWDTNGVDQEQRKLESLLDLENLSLALLR